MRKVKNSLTREWEKKLLHKQGYHKKNNIKREKKRKKKKISRIKQGASSSRTKEIWIFIRTGRKEVHLDLRDKVIIIMENGGGRQTRRGKREKKVQFIILIAASLWKSQTSLFQFYSNSLDGGVNFYFERATKSFYFWCMHWIIYEWVWEALRIRFLSVMHTSCQPADTPHSLARY